jgi:hypothetical protein
MGLVYILMTMSVFTISLNAGFHFFFIQFMTLVYDYQLLYICFIGIGWLFSYFINLGMMLLNLDDTLFEQYDTLVV